MPPFPERESSILAKLKRKKGPGILPDIDDAQWNGNVEHSESAEGTNKVNPVMSCTLLVGRAKRFHQRAFLYFSIEEKKNMSHK